jgi:hypothetical protein
MLPLLTLVMLVAAVGALLVQLALVAQLPVPEFQSVSANAGVASAATVNPVDASQAQRRTPAKVSARFDGECALRIASPRST